MSRFTDQIVLLDTVSAASNTLSVTAATDVVNWTAHPFVNGDRVSVYNPPPAVLPGGLTTGIGYFVVSAATNTFKLSLTSGGSAVDITDTGSGGSSLIFKEYSKVADVSSYDSVTVTVNVEDPVSGLGAVFIYFRGSVLDTLPDFLLPQSVSNQWDNMSLYDVETISTDLPGMLAGDTSISFDDSVGQFSYRIDVRGLKWLSCTTNRFFTGIVRVVAKIDGV